MAPGGDLSASPADAPPFAPAALPMDPAPDGVRSVGGAHPTAVVATPDGAYAYVAMTNVDRIATVQLRGTPRAVGGTELRLFDHGPYGTQPAALALSHDGSRLYVALAGLNAVAVIDAHDPVHLHRLGLIPTGWYPTALALAADDRTLYVANTKGFGHEAGFTGDPETDADSNATWSTLERIDLGPCGSRRDADHAREHAPRVSAPVAIPRASPTWSCCSRRTRRSTRCWATSARRTAIRRWSRSARASPRICTRSRSATALAANVFADAEESDAGHQFFAGGMATLYSERTLFAKSGRRPLVNKNEDPEDYPRLGYVFNALQRRGLAYRDYGDLVRVSGYDEGKRPIPRPTTPSSPASTTRRADQDLGGLYCEDVPAPAALAGHVDLSYPGWNLRIRDERRAQRVRARLRGAGRGGAPAALHLRLAAGRPHRGRTGHPADSRRGRRRRPRAGRDRAVPLAPAVVAAHRDRS